MLEFYLEVGLIENDTIAKYLEEKGSPFEPPFEPLLRREGFNIIPNLVELFEWNDDFTQIAIRLKEEVKMADSRDFTADALQEILEEHKDKLENYVRSEVIDNRRIMVFFSAPTPSFVEELTAIEIPIRD